MARGNDQRDLEKLVYPGKNIEQMPILIGEGMTPLSVSEGMERRLDCIEHPEREDFYFRNYFDTRDGIAYGRKGKAKIVLDCQELMRITPESRLYEGGLIISQRAYDRLKGFEFKIGGTEGVNIFLNRVQAKENEIWGVLARSQELLDNYVGYIFFKGKDLFNPKVAMRILIDNMKVDTPVIRSLCMNTFNLWANLDGRKIDSRLDSENGRIMARPA
jgi:hypothetical protein|tara:strand:- start:6543 stop:7193 length:651 start_codon:yes stop_codon:yes gene_type:complete